MSQELKAIGILTDLRDNFIYGELHGNIHEAIKELEEYEQNFKQKEFDYRTECQSILSTGRVEADNMPDRLAELEKVILDYYLAKGYPAGVGGWNFKIHIETFYKWKLLFIMFTANKYSEAEVIYHNLSETTKEMWDKSIEHFTTRQNEVTNEQ